MTENNRLKIETTKEQRQRAESIAYARNKKEQKFGAMTYGGKRSGIEAHLLGVIVELVVAEYFGVDVDTRVFNNSGDDGTDLVLPNYGRTQIKGTTYWTKPWLRAEVEHDHVGIDTYFLAYVNPDISEVWLIGWLPRSEVILKPKKTLVDDGPLNYIAKETELNTFEENV